MADYSFYTVAYKLRTDVVRIEDTRRTACLGFFAPQLLPLVRPGAKLRWRIQLEERGDGEGNLGGRADSKRVRGLEAGRNSRIDNLEITHVCVCICVRSDRTGRWGDKTDKWGMVSQTAWQKNGFGGSK